MYKKNETEQWCILESNGMFLIKNERRLMFDTCTCINFNMTRDNILIIIFLYISKILKNNFTLVVNISIGHSYK